jgi:hypothetical protein
MKTVKKKKTRKRKGKKVSEEKKTTKMWVENKPQNKIKNNNIK